MLGLMLQAQVTLLQYFKYSSGQGQEFSIFQTGQSLALQDRGSSLQLPKILSLPIEKCLCHTWTQNSPDIKN